MARRVKVSSIGAPSPSLGPDLSEDFLIEKIIGFWRGQLAQVLPDKPDLIVLPELCDCYIEHTPAQKFRFREARGDRVLNFFQGVAREHNCYIAYPTERLAADGSWRNTALMLDRRGDVVGRYDKNHPVITETSESQILCGIDAPIVECDFGRVAFAICFDLNFEVLRARYQTQQPDLILFPSMYHGGIMQGYWAYSCRAHFVGCIGIANLPSEIYSPVAHKVATSTNYFNYVTTTLNLDCKVVHLGYNLEKLKALKAQYGEGVTIFDPGELAAVLVTSERDDLSAAAMLQEFEVELIDDYFARSLAHQTDPRNRGAC